MVPRGFSEYVGCPSRRLRVSHYLLRVPRVAYEQSRGSPTPLLGCSVVFFRSFVGCRAPVIRVEYADPGTPGCSGCPCSPLDLLLSLGWFLPWRSAASRGRLCSGSPHVPVGTRVSPGRLKHGAGNEPPRAVHWASNTGQSASPVDRSLPCVG